MPDAPVRGRVRPRSRPSMRVPETASSRDMRSVVPWILWSASQRLRMEVGVLRGIKSRAEADVRANSAQPVLT
jgi:hypothetical protein